jgi:UDP-GlcNAc:undecaprenyl-phosphate GlcNAc-1-phosphate transferase
VSATTVSPALRSTIFPAGHAAFGTLLGLAVAWLGPSADSRPLQWLYLVGMSCAVSFFAVPLVHRLAAWQGIVDVPSARKVHVVPTPLLGGLAVFVGFAVTTLVNFQFSVELKGVALGAAIVVAIGIADDVVQIPAWLKLLGQVVAAAVALVYGVQLLLVPYWLPGATLLNVIATVLWLLTVTNAVQFLDGMDGLAAGLGAISAVFFSIAAVHLHQSHLMFLAAALMGACLGFLPYNFRPGGARIFLGDSGASFIGFTLAALAVMGEWSASSPLVALFTPLLILAVPLFDIAFVGVVRVVTGKVTTFGEWLAYTGKDHLHHRFEALGLTKTQSVLLIYFIALTLGLSAIVLNGEDPRDGALILAQAVCVLAIIAVLEGVGRGRGSR